MTPEQRFRRLLRWYPRSWRERNEAVVLGTMLDDADHTGRTAPSAAERMSAIGHGLGVRLDVRFASGAAVAALVVAAVAGVLTVWATAPLAAVGASWVLPALTATVAPWLAAVGWISLARFRGFVSDPRAVVLVALAAVTFVAAGLAQLSWAAAFRAADEGVALDGLGGAWAGLTLAGWTLGTVAIALFISAPLHRAGMSALGSVALAAIIGGVLALVIGGSLMSPYTAGITAASLALGSALHSRPRHPRPADLSTATPPRPPTLARTRNLVRALAILSATVSAVGVVYALTGSHWGVPVDATEAMADGITIALLAALPLIAAAGVLGARGRIHRLHTWGPLLLVALALGTVAVAYQGGPAWNSMVLGFTIASALVGAAIAWWLAARLRGRARTTIAVLLGIAFAAFPGIALMPMLAFIVPVLSIAVAIWAPRQSRPHGRPPSSNVSAVIPATTAHHMPRD